MSSPYVGRLFMIQQPDGSTVRMLGWGNQDKAVFLREDGVLLAPDPVSGELQTLIPETQALSTQSIREAVLAGEAPKMCNGDWEHRVRGLLRTVPNGSSHADRGVARWEERRQEQRLRGLRDGRGPEMLQPPQEQRIGQYTGLCLLIDFPDERGTIAPAEVERFCNQPGYTGFGNQGSVRDYFHDVSRQKLEYSNIVTQYYTTRHNREYYTDPLIEYGIRAEELIHEALDHLIAVDFDFGQLSADSGGHVYAINIFYAGPLVNGWGRGLWPHAGFLFPRKKLAAGRSAADYQFTNMGHELTLGVFCHENGHMLCDFPDLYDKGGQSYGAGCFCHMATGSRDEKKPVSMGAYLRYKAGWADRVHQLAPGMKVVLNSARNDFGISSMHGKEYFILEARHQSGRDAGLPGSGLAIWHVDEAGNNNHEQMTPAKHYECSLEQADGAFDLERRKNAGDAQDLFSTATRTTFNDASQPSSKWWDGTSSGLSIQNIGPGESVMSFEVG